MCLVINDLHTGQMLSVEKPANEKETWKASREPELLAFPSESKEYSGSTRLGHLLASLLPSSYD